MRQELYDACMSLYGLSLEDYAEVMNQMLFTHPMMVFNPNIKSVDEVVSICQNGTCLQINVGKINE